MSIYLLFYDTSHGSREEWNTFYTPVEAFSTKESRVLRKNWLNQRYSSLEFYELDIGYSSSHEDIERPLEDDIVEN